MDKQHIVIYHIDQEQEAMAASILMTEQELILHYARTSDEVQTYGTRYSITAVIMECDTADERILQEGENVRLLSMPVLLVCHRVSAKHCPLTVLIKPESVTPAFARQLLVHVLVLQKATSKAKAGQQGTASRAVIGIGASAGGPHALCEILRHVPEDICGIVVVQHMAIKQLHSFIRYLDALCEPAVVLASEHALIRNGMVYIAAEDRHLQVIKETDGFYLHLKQGPKVNFVRPSIDILFSSLASQVKAQAAGVLLTGMGTDGARGLLEMKQAGAFTIIQDEPSCELYGMPREAKSLQAQCVELPLDRIADTLWRHYEVKGRKRGNGT